MSDEKRTTYIVTVWIETVVVQDEATPDVYGTIELTDEEYSVLDERLNALLDEDFIEEYSIREVEVPEELTMSGILMSIVEPREDADAQEAAQIWHNVKPETT